MKEIDLQKMLVDLVTERGGYAHKRSHKFLAGVADLLIKVPMWPAFIAEVKLRVMDAKNLRTFILNDVTTLQKKDLRDAQKAGMNAAVISFLCTAAGKRSLHVGAFMVEALERHKYEVSTSHHMFVGDAETRDQQLWNMLVHIATMKYVIGNDDGDAR